MARLPAVSPLAVGVHGAGCGAGLTQRVRVSGSVAWNWFIAHSGVVGHVEIHGVAELNDVGRGVWFNLMTFREGVLWACGPYAIAVSTPCLIAVCLRVHGCAVAFWP